MRNTDVSDPVPAGIPATPPHVVVDYEKIKVAMPDVTQWSQRPNEACGIGCSYEL